jgi:hypothetical protein
MGYRYRLVTGHTLVNTPFQHFLIANVMVYALCFYVILCLMMIVLKILISSALPTSRLGL